AYEYQRAVEKGEVAVVGVNKFATVGEAHREPDLEIEQASPEAARDAADRVRRVKSSRDADSARSALRRLSDAAAGSGNVQPSIREAVAAAVQEDVDVIGLSILSGAHESICRRLNEELSRREARIPIVVGGIIPAADFAKLKDLGVAAVFGPESPLAAVVETVRELATNPNATSTATSPSQSHLHAREGIPATRLDHTAICVRDIDASIALIEDLLGQKVAHKEFVPAQKVQAAFFDFPNGASLELVAPQVNDGLEKFLQKRGGALHHFALRVRDLDALLARLESA